ncbi:uncharacterized protein LOC129612883 [Condylostylus longicornis]|uniref:uncharacterized protein LOC129612883 n=1 Tax=Condylostylus longicornis TaxID=2530218 RepID=UPI00244DF4BF|nr:uncharacterized protein LOC129612883 [Condylostylus longicornis]
MSENNQMDPSATDNNDLSLNELENETTINDLDEYSLIKIFNYLTFRDQILFASLNRRFRTILFTQFKNDKMYTLDLNYKYWSLSDLYNAFQLIGPITKSFQITKNNENLSRVYLCIDFVLEYCCNLYELRLECIQSVNKYINQMSQMLKNIVYLELKFCSLIDIDIKLLNNLKNIQHLDISKNQKLTGKYIENFVNLQTLKVAECNQIKEKYFIAIFNNMKSLKHLDTQHCSEINHTAIFALVDSCGEIETLKIYVRYATESLKRISELKKLKELHIEEGWSCGNSVDDTRRLRNIVNDLLKMLSNQLTSLKIHFLQFDHDKGLNWARFESIYTMKNLKELHFVGYLSCYVIDWHTLRHFVENSNLKILNITYSNFALGFASNDFNNFILSCINAKKLDEINLKYSGRFSHPEFLENFYETLDGKGNTKPMIKMKIKVNPKVENDILNNPKYVNAKDLSNLIMKTVRSSYDDHFRYMIYEEDEEINEFESVRDESRCGEIRITLNSNII